ncbi:TPA: hemin uptake protein HemP [Citrobacter freundii]
MSGLYKDKNQLPHARESDIASPSHAVARRINSQILLGTEGKVVIDHDGQQYLLRKTQAGKLLLTK